MEGFSTVKTVCLAGALAGTVFAPSAVGAQTQLSDELRIIDGAGKVRYDAKVLETSTNPESPSVHFVVIKGVSSLFDPSQYGHFIALVDQTPVTRISDVVGIYPTKTPTGVVLHFAFASDNEQMSPPLKNWVAPGVPPPPPIPEQGPVNVTRFLNPGLQANHWTAFFASDVVAMGGVRIPTTAPEPGVWAMMLAGLAGIGVALRSARRRNPEAA